MGRSTRWPASAAATLIVLASLAGQVCASVPRSRRAEARKADYFAVSREISDVDRSAIERGHVLPGMDAEQVWVVLGEPGWRRRFVSRTGSVDIWIYQGIRLHQDQMRATAHSTFRIVFVDGRVRLIEPL